MRLIISAPRFNRLIVAATVTALEACGLPVVYDPGTHVFNLHNGHHYFAIDAFNGDLVFDSSAPRGVWIPYSETLLQSFARLHLFRPAAWLLTRFQRWPQVRHGIVVTRYFPNGVTQ